MMGSRQLKGQGEEAVLPRGQGHHKESGAVEMWAPLEEMLEEERKGENTLASSFPLPSSLPLVPPLAKLSRKPEHPGV